MPAPILTTKLFVPPPRPRLVSRPRLVERLDAGLARGGQLTLISASAGFGKTTLVSEWAARCGRAVAWLSLDSGDHEPAGFIAYLVSALRTLQAGFGEAALAALQAPSPPPVEAILATLLNDITAFPVNFVLVLDDYHATDSQPVDQVLAFLVEHLPPPMHLVIATREDPSLPLARLRARGQLTELRAADLRFTAAEAADFLNRVMGLQLSEAEVAALEDRAEGWIAGLQLAALSLQGRDDVAGFIQAFTGSHRYVLDYLVEEVLQRQPEPIRRFLLQTAVLDRFCAPLCNAVTGRADSHAMLEALDRSNLFLVPLDDRRHWYRSHHLFAEVLRMRLMAEQPDQLPGLHRRASEWCEQNGLVGEAVHHALAAQDFDRAARLIEQALPAMRQGRQEAVLLGWFKALPEGMFQSRPVLSAHYAGTLLQMGQWEGVETRLREAERWLAPPDDGRERPIYVDEEDFHRLPGSIGMYRAAIALMHGDVANTLKHAQQVLDGARADDDFMRGAASALLGLAFWTSGDLEIAYQRYAEGMAYLQKVGYISDVIGGSVTLADIRLTQGRLREALHIYERGLQLATPPGEPARRGAADMHVGLSDLYRERNELETAAQHLERSRELGELNGLPKNPYRSRVAMARLQEARGDLDGALDLLAEAERRYEGDFSPNVRPVQAVKARVWVSQGRLGEAHGWAREQGLSAGDDLNYRREFEHVTLARLLLATYKRDQDARVISEAIGLMERLLKAAEAGGRTGTVIELLVLQAVAHQLQGDVPAALGRLQQALKLAEPEGYIRLFLDEGASLAGLLREAVARGIRPAYASRLLAAFEAGQPGVAGKEPRPTPTPAQPLIEPLSQRELEILRLFKTELSGPEIARELVVALSTVRTHTKSIYSKLNVNSRRAAVKRAEELGLI